MPIINITGLNSSRIKNIELIGNVNYPTIEFSPNYPKCCVFNSCTACGNTRIPTLFIHGHAVNDDNRPEDTMRVFTKLQSAMSEHNYINAGELDLKEGIEGEIGNQGWPIVIRATYYYQPYYSLGKYNIQVDNNQHVEEYSKRLNSIVQQVKRMTGSEKINIVAHSMGGLVARKYIEIYGTSDINKIITINSG